MKKKITINDINRIQAKRNKLTAKIKKQTAKTIKQAALKTKNTAKNITLHNKQKKESKNNFSKIFQSFKNIFKENNTKFYKRSTHEHTAVKNINRAIAIGKIILVCVFLICMITAIIIRSNTASIIFNYPFDTTANKIEITDYFGVRTDPFTGAEGDFHHGIDFALNWHSPIFASADGKVTFAGANDSLGNYVMIRHGLFGKTCYTLYGHLSAIFVQEGDKVKAGQTIGLEGGDPNKDPNPGSSTGDHLHFAMLDKDEKYIDPLGKLILK